MANRNGPILGPFNEATLADPLKIAKKIGRESLLQQSEGAGLFEQAVVVEIDEVGGLFGNPDVQFGAPRFSIRARVLDQSGDGANSDLLRSSDELKVCFPFNSSYHLHQPIKVGEKVWVFELPGIGGVTQRYWMHRTPSPSPLSLAPFARPNNNYADGSFEANLLRDPDEEGVNVNTDRDNSDTIERMAARVEGFADSVNPETAPSHFSKMADDSATMYGFVNEHFPEWFYRPSDTVLQGSNNSGVLLGTNMVTIEDDEDAPDIADIISIYGGSNDASDFANARDRDVIRADRAPISARAEEETAVVHAVAGRRFNLQSFTHDASRLSLFQNVNVDNVAPFMGEIAENLGAEAPESGPAALLRSTDVRVAARRTMSLSAGSAAGVVIDDQEEGRILGTAPRLLRFTVGSNMLEIDGTEGKAKLDVGVSKLELDQLMAKLESGPSSVEINAAGVTVTGTTLALAFSQLSLPAQVTTNRPVNMASGIVAGPGDRAHGVANKITLTEIAAEFRVQAATFSAPPLTPVGAALNALASIIENAMVSTVLKG